MYRPTAAGHAAKDAPQQVAQDDLDELVERAQTWLTRRDNSHEALRRATEGVSTTAHVAGLLARHPVLSQHPDYAILGPFISALWNKHCPENIIVYPHDTPEINDLGYRLPPHKMLVLQGATGHFTGRVAEGPVLVLGRTGICTGRLSKAPIIIASTIDRFAMDMAAGPLIRLTHTDVDSTYKGKHITPRQYARNNSLREYVDRLITLAKDDPDMIERKFGNGEQITTTLNEYCALRWWDCVKPKEAQR